MRSFNDNQKWVGHKRHKLHEIRFSSFTTLDSDIKKMKITIYSNSHSKQNIVITKQLERSNSIFDNTTISAYFEYREYFIVTKMI